MLFWIWFALVTQSSILIFYISANFQLNFILTIVGYVGKHYYVMRDVDAELASLPVHGTKFKNWKLFTLL